MSCDAESEWRAYFNKFKEMCDASDRDIVNLEPPKTPYTYSTMLYRGAARPCSLYEVIQFSKDEEFVLYCKDKMPLLKPATGTFLSNPNIHFMIGSYSWDTIKAFVEFKDEPGHPSMKYDIGGAVLVSAYEEQNIPVLKVLSEFENLDFYKPYWNFPRIDNNVECLQLLLKNKHVPRTFEIITRAIDKGHSKDIVEFFIKNGFPLRSDARLSAIERRDQDIIEVLDKYDCPPRVSADVYKEGFCPKPYSGSRFADLVYTGDFEAAKQVWYSEFIGWHPRDEELQVASGLVRCGSVEFMEWLHSVGFVAWTHDTLATLNIYNMYHKKVELKELVTVAYWNQYNSKFPLPMMRRFFELYKREDFTAQDGDNTCAQISEIYSRYPIVIHFNLMRDIVMELTSEQ